MRKKPGALVMHGDHLGSLCAARSLGEAGIDVTFADESMLSPGTCSRFVRRVRSPNPCNLDAYLSWLRELGRSTPGLFLYPCSDDLAWVLGHHRRELQQHFLLHQPESEAFLHLLDKRRLYEHAAKLGIGVPETHYPRDPQELDAIAGTVSLPAIVKPRTQMCFPSKVKGFFCETRESLRAAHRAFVTRHHYRPEILQVDSTIAQPMIQRYIPYGLDNIYSVAGLYDARTDTHVMLGSQKLLQRPRRIGVGVAFEARSVPAELRDAVVALCRAVGYFGIFEVEFIRDRTADRFVLTDFNPRYYGQMAFEVARGLPLPLLAYHRACGDDLSFDNLMHETCARIERCESEKAKFVNGTVMNLLLRAQRASRAMSRAEYDAWRKWLRDDEHPPTDALEYPGDPMPALIARAHLTWHCVRHPRSFVRTFTSLR